MKTQNYSNTIIYSIRLLKRENTYKIDVLCIQKLNV